MPEEIPEYLRRENIEEEVFNYLSKKAYEYFPFSVAVGFQECQSVEEMRMIFDEYLSSCGMQETWDDLIDFIIKKRKEHGRPIIVSFFIDEFVSKLKEKYGIKTIEKELTDTISSIAKENALDLEKLLIIFLKYQKKQYGDEYLDIDRWWNIRAYIANPSFLSSIVSSFIRFLEENTYCVENICYVDFDGKYHIVTGGLPKIEYDYNEQELTLGTYKFSVPTSAFERLLRILSDIVSITRGAYFARFRSDVELYRYIAKMIELCKILGVAFPDMPSMIEEISEMLHLSDTKEIRDEAEDLISFYVGTELEKEELFDYLYEKKGKEFVASAIKSESFDDFIEKLFRKIRSRDLTALLVVSYGLYPEEYEEFYSRIRSSPRDAIYAVAKFVLGIEEKRELEFMGVKLIGWLDTIGTMGFFFVDEEQLERIIANTMHVELKYDEDRDLYYAVSNGEMVDRDMYSAELIDTIKKFFRTLPKEYCREVEYRVRFPSETEPHPSILVVVCHGQYPFIILVAPYSV